MEQQSFAGVRIANPADGDTLYAHLLNLHGENAIAPLNPVKARVAVQSMVSQRGGISGIIDGEKGIEASIGLFLNQPFYSDAWHLEEVWNFVHPDHRRTTHAKRLLEFGKWCADRLKVPLFASILTTTRLAPKMRLYQRQLKQVGATFAHGQLVHDDFTNQREFSQVTFATEKDIGFARNPVAATG